MGMLELFIKVRDVGEVGGVAGAASGWTPKCLSLHFEAAFGVRYRACRVCIW
jgi:hypothetical protein